LVKELSAAFKPKGLLLSAAVSPSKKVIDEGYDVPVLNQYLDHINVMTYDYYGHWDKQTGHVAPLYHHPNASTFEFNCVSLIILVTNYFKYIEYSVHFFVKNKYQILYVHYT